VTMQQMTGRPQGPHHPWLAQLVELLQNPRSAETQQLLKALQMNGVETPMSPTQATVTPYINTIPMDQQASFPGDEELEARIEGLVRWNAMAMVLRANQKDGTIGGHISSYASAATLYEVGFNHFFRGRGEKRTGDQVYFQAHISPGIYARAFLEGRFSTDDLERFRRELDPKGGLSSYPHPWLMPNFWEFPTVSMGLGPVMAIYQARFNQYLEDRGFQPNTSRVWAFLGDGETDEPEALGAISLAAREKLDRLTFIINCNLQRLDGPVRGNGNIIQELETLFRGAGWNVIKVIWGSDWDPIFANDSEGLLAERVSQLVDGELQKYSFAGGAYLRANLFGQDPRLLALVNHLSDRQLADLKMGGHDRRKVYAAYKAAVEHRGSPTVILVRTVKGFGLGEGYEATNVSHVHKKFDQQDLLDFRTRFDLPVPTEVIHDVQFYLPSPESAEIRYLQAQRQRLGGYVPARNPHCPPVDLPAAEPFDEFARGTGLRTVSTTTSFVRMLTLLLRDAKLGRLLVPIVADEARAFGMEAIIRQFGIYAHSGQLYEPVDAEMLLYYKESQESQVLEEGINETGAISSFIAAGTAYATHGINTIPFFILYSIFGFQRIGDLLWAAADVRARGFLVGGVAGRTTLPGEGFQHQDGHSHVLASTIPNVMAYDPAFGYEIAVIVQEGIRRMYVEQENLFYYLTVYNENYPMPPMAAAPDVRTGILKGMYKYKASTKNSARWHAQLLGSGPILNEVLRAQQYLESHYEIAADVWSVTSYKELRRDALEAERWNLLHPAETPRIPYVNQCLDQTAKDSVLVAASDYMKLLPDSISRWLPRPLISLGTDGFGRSDGRPALRDFFEVDYRYIVLATLTGLLREGQLDASLVDDALSKLAINPDKLNPLTA
jgi:pyruvate dehydrogenase E1 component